MTGAPQLPAVLRPPPDPLPGAAPAAAWLKLAAIIDQSAGQPAGITAMLESAYVETVDLQRAIDDAAAGRTPIGLSPTDRHVTAQRFRAWLSEFGPSPALMIEPRQ